MKKLLLLLCFVLFFATTSNAAILFQDDFESGLTNWSTIYGQAVTDPSNSNNTVLNFRQTNSGGDTYTLSAFIDGMGAGTYTLEFDYYSGETSYNGGGFVGIDTDGTKGGDHTWLLGTNSYPNTTNLPYSNGAWVSVSLTFTTTYPQIYLMIEDFYAPAADAYFDNFMLSDTAPVPEPATMVLLGAGLLGLAAIGRKKFLKK